MTKVRGMRKNALSLDEAISAAPIVIVIATAAGGLIGQLAGWVVT